MITSQNINPKKLFEEGQKLGRLGELEKAGNLLIEAARMRQEDENFLFEVAKELEQIKRFGKAHEVYITLLQQNPQNYIAHARLGWLFLELDQYTLAVRHLEKAHAINPDDPDVLNNLGLVYQCGEEIDKAVDAFKLALEKGAPANIVMGTLAGLLEQTNRLDEMEPLLEKALRDFPDDVYINLIAAKADRRNKQPEKALKRLMSVKDRETTNDLVVLYNFELGRVHDQLDDVGLAMKYFEIGNEQIKKEPDFARSDPKVALRQIEAMKNLDLKEWLDTTADPLANDLDVPAFLVGFPRSGTTLLNQILDGHPEMEAMEEINFFGHQKPQLEREYGPYPEILTKLTTDQLNKYRDEYLDASRYFISKEGGVKIIDKLPLNLLDIPWILKLFPNAKIILALRHPCDCTLSCYMQNFAMNNAMNNFLSLDSSTRYYERVMGLWHHYLDNLDIEYHPVCYEKIIQNLETEAKALVAFLGLSWDDQVLDYRKQAESKKHINTPSYHQVIKPLYREADGRWVRYRKFLEPYLDRLKPFCDAFDYKV